MSSPTLNLLPNNLQGYGPSESLPCLGVSGRAVSVSRYSRGERRALQMSLVSPKCYLRHKSFVCKASSGSGGQRRNPDFSRQNRQGFSRSWNRQKEESDGSDSLDESEFLSTKNGPLLSLSNNHKSQPTASPGPREREIVELFRKVQAQLRERAAVKEKKAEAGKEQNKEIQPVDSLLQLLRKHSVEKGKRKVNGGGNTNDFGFDRSTTRRQSVKSNKEKSRGFFDSTSTVREEPQETNKPSYSRPVSIFRRRSPVPKIRYEPIVSSEDSFESVSHSSELDDKASEIHSGLDLEPEAESDSDIDPDMDISSGLELDQEEEEVEEEIETELLRETDSVNGHAAEFDGTELKDLNFGEKATAAKPRTELKDLNAMKLAELRALAKARGMKGFSKLKKSELVGILSEDAL